MRTTVYPFTQIYEDVMKEMRESSVESTVKDKYRRRVNQIYQFDVPSRYEWDWLRRQATLSVYKAYQDGTVDATEGSTTITGTSTAWTAAMDGWKIKLSGDNTVYAFTYVSPTSATISPAFLGTTATGQTHTTFQCTYTLPADFSKFPVKEPRVYYYIAGFQTSVKWLNDPEFQRRSTYIPSLWPYAWREHPSLTSLGYKQLELVAPITQNMAFGLEYIKAQSEMYEVTDTAATGSTTTKLLTTNNIASNITPGMYVRVDANGEWSLVQAVAANTTTGAGITVTFRTAPTNAQAITVSSVPEMPLTMQHSLFYGACMLTGLEQNDPAAQGYVTSYVATIDQAMATKNRKRYGDQRLHIQSRRG